eukprot:1185584-Prorocentrum_minimum.AAC.1
MHITWRIRCFFSSKEAVLFEGGVTHVSLLVTHLSPPWRSWRWAVCRIRRFTSSYWGDRLPSRTGSLCGGGAEGVLGGVQRGSGGGPELTACTGSLSVSISASASVSTSADFRSLSACAAAPACFGGGVVG